jgi:hypothetical protein
VGLSVKTFNEYTYEKYDAKMLVSASVVDAGSLSREGRTESCS